MYRSSLYFVWLDDILQSYAPWTKEFLKLFKVFSRKFVYGSVYNDES